MNSLKSIAEVVYALDEVIQWSIARNSRIGYFAALYRQMTLAVQQGIVAGAFDDGPRMERLDVMFAMRYLHAWKQFTETGVCTDGWCFVFEACKRNDLVVLQHLLLGINTHINFDLGIAAALTCPGNAIYGLENDFNRINDVIAGVGQRMQLNLAKVWFPLRFLQKLTNRKEEPVLNFSIKVARDTSWANGVALALVTGTAQTNYLAMIEKTVVKIGNRVMNPGPVKWLLRPVVWTESRNVANIIEILNR